jgi:hypothetical protein
MLGAEAGSTTDDTTAMVSDCSQLYALGGCLGGYFRFIGIGIFT